MSAAVNHSLRCGWRRPGEASDGARRSAVLVQKRGEGVNAVPVQPGTA